MENEHTKNSTRMILVFITMLVLILGALLFSSIKRRDRAQVVVNTAPREAVISIDDKRVGNSTWLSPGKHALSVSYEGFSTYTKSFDTKPNSPALNFSVALTPQTTQAKKIASSETSRYLEIESKGGQQAEDTGSDFIKNNPVAAYVPYKTSYYSIDYGKDAGGNLDIQITSSSPLGRQVALEKIRSWGFDPTDYLIVFFGLNNPFTNGIQGRQ